MTILARLDKFFLEGLWGTGDPAAAGHSSSSGPDATGRRHSRSRLWPLRILRVLVLTYEGFFADLCLLRASALTFASLMALVPVFAVSFSVLQGMGWSGQRLETLILERVTLLSPEAIDTVVRYIDNTSAAGLGVAGGLILLGTYISVMFQIEISFNAIWGDAPPRALLRQLGYYLAVMVLAPLTLALAISLTAALRSNSVVEWTLASALGPTLVSSLAVLSYALAWLVFAFFYFFIPAAKVRAVPALIGGVVGGTIWQLSHIAYVSLQFGVVGYNAIYGVMAQLPLLMVWLYISWVIVLLGAEVAAAVQNLEVISLDRQRALVGFAEREFLGIKLVVALAQSALARRPAPTVEELAADNFLPLRSLGDVVADLESHGIVHEGGEHRRCLFLSLAPSSIPISVVMSALRGDADSQDDCEDAQESAGRDHRIAGLLADLRQGRAAVLGGTTVADLVDGDAGVGPGPMVTSGALG